ncbi:MAG: phage late control D family protein, partial [Dehalococcoidia bacterium]
MADSPELNSNELLTLTISSNGNKIADTIGVLSVTVNKAVNRIPYARIVLQDGDLPSQKFPLSDEDVFKPGAEIKISASYNDSEDVIFQGVIVKHGIKISAPDYSRLVIECRDPAAAMTLGRKNANYVDSTDSAIISTLIGNYSGLSSEVDSTSVTWKELVQYYCTDWDFLMSRAEVNGLLVVVDEGKVSVKAPQTSDPPQLSVAYGVDLIEFDADIDARTQLTSVKGTAWDPKKQTVLEGKESKPPDLNQQGNLKLAELAQVVAPDSFRLQTSVPLEKTALEAWSDGQQLKAGLARIRGHMKFQGNSKAKVGTLIELSGVGDRFNGNVFVSTVIHEITSD